MASSFGDEFEKLWSILDADGNGVLDLNNVKQMLQSHIIEEDTKAILNDIIKNNKSMSKSELKDFLKGKEGSILVLAKGVKDGSGFVATGMVGHRSIEYEELQGIAGWINFKMKDKKSVSHLLPLTEKGLDLFEKVADGIILCELINMAVRETIDERAINLVKKGKLSIFEALENLDLALKSASAIGCVVIGMDRESLRDGAGRPHLVLGLVWQIIEKQLFEGINVHEIPGLKNLLMEGQDINDLLRLSPTEILLRWVNYQLEQKGVPKRIDNFKGDIKDSEAYIHLLDAVAPKDKCVTTDALGISDLTNRANSMLDEADKIGCKQFLTGNDVVKGREKLNIAFTANLLNCYPNMDPPEEEEVIVETREEKMYRNWMNSLGVSPKVKYLYTDLDDGLILFQLMDFIHPGIVDWKRVVKKFDHNPAKAKMEQMGNCSYAVEVGKKMELSLPGTGGKDIYDKIKKLVLGMVWQLMREYTISLLKKLNPTETKSNKEVEADIVQWTNEKLTTAGKDTQITSFKDKALATSLPCLDLIDATKPGAINYSYVIKDASTEEDRLNNAKLAVSMARKIGAPIYALPEDLVEGKFQMIMTIFACIMLVGNKS